MLIPKAYSVIPAKAGIQFNKLVMHPFFFMWAVLKETRDLTQIGRYIQTIFLYYLMTTTVMAATGIQRMSRGLL
ncbi:MAG: hypothetical protein V1689_11085 [Pseudomonadota bacterium]